MPQRHRQELSESVTADPLVTYRRTPRTFRPGRQCAVPGCQTVLSIYNGAKHCAAHNPTQARVAPARAPAEAAAVALSTSDAGRVTPGPRPPVRVFVAPGGEVTRRAS